MAEIEELKEIIVCYLKEIEELTTDLGMYQQENAKLKAQIEQMKKNR